MWVTKQKTRLQELYREFPRAFWTLTAATFIDRVGGALLYLFFALYFTSRFGVGLIVESGQPARQAMVADLLPEEKRAERRASRLCS
jgi:MFS family permease